MKDHRKVVAWLASFVCVVSVGCAVLGLVFLYLNGNFASILEEEGVDAVAAAAFPTVGATIAARRPGNPIGWIFCLTGLSLGVAIFASGYAEYALVTQPDALPAGILAAWLGTWTWLPGIVLGPTFLLLLFPHGRLPSRRWRPVPWFSVGATALGVGVIMVLPWSSLDISLPAENPFEIADAQTIEFAAFAFGIGAGMVSMALSVLALILRFRRSRGVERQQLKWFVYAGTLTVVLLFLPLFPAFGVVGSFLQVLAAPLLPAAAGVAILRHRLYDIDVLVNRTLVYGALTATLALVYLGGVATTQTVFRFLTEQDQQPQLAVVASTLLIAALFNPLRRRIQSFIDRRFYRSKYDARKTLEDFSTRLREETDLDGLTAELLEVTRQTMQPARVSLWLRRPTSDREPDVDSR